MLLLGCVVGLRPGPGGTSEGHQGGGHTPSRQDAGSGALSSSKSFAGRPIATCRRHADRAGGPTPSEGNSASPTPVVEGRPELIPGPRAGGHQMVHAMHALRSTRPASLLAQPSSRPAALPRRPHLHGRVALALQEHPGRRRKAAAAAGATVPRKGPEAALEEAQHFGQRIGRAGV